MTDLGDVIEDEGGTMQHQEDAYLRQRQQYAYRSIERKIIKLKTNLAKNCAISVGYSALELWAIGSWVDLHSTAPSLLSEMSISSAFVGVSISAAVCVGGFGLVHYVRKTYSDYHTVKELKQSPKYQTLFSETKGEN